METNEKLEKGVGTKDMKVLEPAKVKILEVGLEAVKFGNETNEKVVLSVLHPEKEEPIVISKAKISRKDKLSISGLWFNLDDDGNIQKGSTLAEVLIYAGVKTPAELKDMEFDTITDENGFLVLKAY